MRWKEALLGSCVLLMACQADDREPINLSEVSGSWLAVGPQVEINEAGDVMTAWSEYSWLEFRSQAHSSHFDPGRGRWTGAQRLPHLENRQNPGPNVGVMPSGEFVSWWSNAERSPSVGVCPAGQLMSSRFDNGDSVWTDPDSPAHALEAGVRMRQTRPNAKGQVGVLYSSARPDTPGLVLLRRNSLDDEWDEGVYVDTAAQPQPGIECPAGYPYAEAGIADDESVLLVGLDSRFDGGVLSNRLFATVLAPGDTTWSEREELEIASSHSLSIAESAAERAYVVWPERPDPADNDSPENRVRLAVFERGTMQWQDMGIINDPEQGRVRGLVIEANRRGDVLIGWSQGVPYVQRLDRSARLVGTPLPIRVRDEMSSVESRHISLALNAHGDAAMGVAYTAGEDDELAVLRLFRHDNELGAPTVVDQGRWAPGVYSEHPYIWDSDVAINDSGDAVVAWSRRNDWGASYRGDEVEVYSRDLWAAHF